MRAAFPTPFRSSHHRKQLCWTRAPPDCRGGTGTSASQTKGHATCRSVTESVGTIGFAGRVAMTQDGDASVAVIDLITGAWRSQMVYAATAIGVFDALGPAGAVSIKDLAGQLGVDGPALYRLLRALASLGCSKSGTASTSRQHRWASVFAGIIRTRFGPWRSSKRVPSSWVPGSTWRTSCAPQARWVQPGIWLTDLRIPPARSGAGPHLFGRDVKLLGIGSAGRAQGLPCGGFRTRYVLRYRRQPRRIACGTFAGPPRCGRNRV